MTKVKAILGVVGALLIVGGVGYWLVNRSGDDAKPVVTDFASCAAAGNPIMESYPEQCAAGGKTYTNTSKTAPAAPDTSQGATTETSDATDAAAIKAAIVTYCQDQGATTADITKVEQVLDANMKNPDLYVKSGSFARLSATCGEGGFRSFLEKHTDNGWTILGNSQMNTISCGILDGTGVSESVADQCYDENGEARAVQ